MQVFINETSLNSQFDDQASFFISFKVFISAIKAIADLKSHKEVFKSNTFFFYTGISNTHLETVLKSNKSINDTFAANWDRINPKSWQKKQIHNSGSSYTYLSDDYRSTSVAEIAERKLSIKEFKGFLLNFPNSQFGSKTAIEIVKNHDIRVEVECNIDAESIYKWLINNNFVHHEQKYDVASGNPPMDYQTVLLDNTQFEKTKYSKNNGRTVFRRIGTDELWVVDGSIRHAGDKAHIEVFDEKTRKHLGTSLYNEIIINDKFKKIGRFINLE